MPKMQAKKAVRVTKKQKIALETAASVLLDASVKMTDIWEDPKCDPLLKVLMQAESRFVLETAFKLQKIAL